MRSFKWLFYAGMAVQVLLCVLAWIFCKERLVLPDNANYLFELLSSDGGPAVFHNRFIALPTQFLPWLAIRAGSSLGTVARLYSLNLELFHAACYLACGFLLRNQRLAVAGLLCHLLITTDTFFWSVSELPLCMAALFPLAALLERKPLGAFEVLLIALGCVSISFGHSLALFPFGFCLGMLWLRRPDRHRVLLLAGLCFAAALTVKAVYFSDPYDRGALGGFRNGLTLFPDYFSTPAMKAFLQRCAGDYFWLPLSFSLVLAHLIHMRHYRQALLLLTSAVGYLLLVTICFPADDPARFYPENLYLPLAFFIAYAALPMAGAGRRWVQMLQILVPALILVSGITRIMLTRQRYAARLEWQRSLIRQYDGQKVILPETAVSPERYLLSWSSPYEFWLLSSLETGRAASIIITKTPDDAAQRAGAERKAFLPAFGLYYYDRLPQRYFPFRDTVQSYRIVADQIP